MLLEGPTSEGLTTTEPACTSNVSPLSVTTTCNGRTAGRKKNNGRGVEDGQTGGSDKGRTGGGATLHHHGPRLRVKGRIIGAYENRNNRRLEGRRLAAAASRIVTPAM